MSLASFMTATFDHYNNPTGAASTSLVLADIACTPIDPAANLPEQQFPVEKLLQMKETFTKYTACQTGDFIVSGGTTYAVRAVWPWAAQGQMDAYQHILCEEALGS